MKHFTIPYHGPNAVHITSRELFQDKLDESVVWEFLRDLHTATGDAPVILFQIADERNNLAGLMTAVSIERPCCISPENAAVTHWVECRQYTSAREPIPGSQALVNAVGFRLWGFLGRCPHCMRGRLIVRTLEILQ